METPGLALQLRLSEELFQNRSDYLIIVKQSEMTASTLCPVVNILSCFIIIHHPLG